MYAFLDCPLSLLDRGGRLLVWAMRHWAKAVSCGGCPCGDVGPAFHKADLMAGFPHFHMMMAVLNRHAREKLSFADVDCPRLSDGEALLLSLIRLPDGAHADQTPATVALVVQPEGAPALRMALDSLGAALRTVELWPALPMFDPATVRFPHE